MKYVASMKMEQEVTSEQLDKLLTSMDLYVREHPAIPDATFTLMVDLSSKLDNPRLHEQCKTAQSRCQETVHLLKSRQARLQHAREHMERESLRRRSNSTIGAVYYGVEPEPPWQPQNTSTPLVSLFSARRRSYAGKPSERAYNSSVGAFRELAKDSEWSEYEEYLFGEGLITKDMSDRITTFLPKGLSECTLRSSRESLRGSRESLHGSAENIQESPKSTSLPRDMAPPSFSPINTSDTVTLNKHDKPHRKMLRRALSAITGGDSKEDTQCSDPYTCNSKTLSMITGSSESLPR